MTTERPKITGYRQLNQAETDLINEGKALAILVGEYVAKVRERGTLLHDAPNAESHRWVSIGATHLQQGFMAVARAVAKPETF